MSVPNQCIITSGNSESMGSTPPHLRPQPKFHPGSTNHYLCDRTGRKTQIYIYSTTQVVDCVALVLSWSGRLPDMVVNMQYQLMRKSFGKSDFTWMHRFYIYICLYIQPIINTKGKKKKNISILRGSLTICLLRS